MTIVDTPFLCATVVEDGIVLIEGRSGVNIDAQKARHVNELIAKAMPGKYGFVINRKEDYSIIPVEVYEVLNGMDRLEAIAVVTHRESSSVFAAIEKSLFHRQFKLCGDVDSARAWVRSVITAAGA